MKIDLQPAYILHRRHFKDSSALLECLTMEHGLVSLVARGAMRSRSRMQGLVQPFILLRLGWLGKSELKTLTHIEADVFYPKLSGQKILLGLYLNELLFRLLQRLDPHPQLFHDYNETLNALSQLHKENALQVVLRQFELKLLAELGYGLDLSCDAKTSQPIIPELLYSYDPGVGIYESSSFISLEKGITVSGASIIALSKGQINSHIQLRETKKLMRFVLAHYLGNKTIQSRKLFPHSLRALQENE